MFRPYRASIASSLILQVPADLFAVLSVAKPRQYYGIASGFAPRPRHKSLAGSPQKSGRKQIALKAQNIPAQGKVGASRPPPWVRGRMGPSPVRAKHKPVNDQSYVAPFQGARWNSVSSPRASPGLVCLSLSGTTESTAL